MVEGFFFFLYFTRGNKTQHIFPTWGCFRSAGCGERENILCLPFLFFCLLFHSIYLFQFFQLVTRQVVVNPLARWCCLTSARNSLSKCVRRRKRGDCEKGRESSRHRQGHHLETHRLITQVALFPFFFYFPIQKYCV